MNDLFRDITSVAMAIVGVAILAVIVSKNNQTGEVLSSAGNAFKSVLGTAMGGASGSSHGIMP